MPKGGVELKVILKHIAIAVALFLLLLWLSTFFIGWYTKHGQQVEVPAVTGMHIEKAIQELDANGFHYEVVDSVYNEGYKKNAVTDQDPAPKSKVKKGRTIYLIVNASTKPQVKVPKLVNSSLNLARVLLRNSGFQVGRITLRKNPMGGGLVLEQYYKGKAVAPGTMLEKGSTIDLLVSEEAMASDSIPPAATPLEPISDKDVF